MSEVSKQVDTESVKRRRLNARPLEKENSEGNVVKSTQHSEPMSEPDDSNQKDKSVAKKRTDGISVPLARRISVNESKHRNNKSIFDRSQNSDVPPKSLNNASTGRETRRYDKSRQESRPSDGSRARDTHDRRSPQPRVVGNGSLQSKSTRDTNTRLDTDRYPGHTGTRRYQDRPREASPRRARNRQYSPPRKEGSRNDYPDNGRSLSIERDRRYQTSDKTSVRKDWEPHATRDRKTDDRMDANSRRSAAPFRPYEHSMDRDRRKGHVRHDGYDHASDEERPRMSNIDDSNHSRRSRNSPAYESSRGNVADRDRDDRRNIARNQDRPRGREFDRESTTRIRPTSTTRSIRSDSVQSSHDYTDRAGHVIVRRPYKTHSQDDDSTDTRGQRAGRDGETEHSYTMPYNSGKDLIRTRFRSPSVDHDSGPDAKRRISRSPRGHSNRARRDSRSPMRAPERRRPLPDQAQLLKNSTRHRSRDRSRERVRPARNQDRSYGGSVRDRRSPETNRSALDDHTTPCRSPVRGSITREERRPDRNRAYETNRGSLNRGRRTEEEGNQSYSQRQDPSRAGQDEAGVPIDDSNGHVKQRSTLLASERGRSELQSPNDDVVHTRSLNERNRDRYMDRQRIADRRTGKREQSEYSEESASKRSKTQQSQLQFRTPESISTPQAGKTSHLSMNNDRGLTADTVHATLEVEGAQLANNSLAVEVSVYERIGQVGEGTYGKVYKARHRGTGELVALKRIRLEQERDGFPITSMREIKLLQRLKHPSIIKLHEMMIEKGSVYMVFEYMDHDLTGILANPNITFESSHIKDLAHQLFDGLAHLHHRGVLHRDMKGSNILLNNAGELKLADFGLARFYNKSRSNADYTNRVITLWFRPPELLLGATAYDAAVDVWSAGCIFVELFTKITIFPGRDEIHQLETIYRVMGTPTIESWPGLTQLPWYELIKFEQFSPKFKDMVPMLTPAALALSLRILQLDPSKRPLAQDILNHDYFIAEEPKAVRRTLLDIAESHEWDTKQRRREDRARKSKEDKEREVQSEEKAVEVVAGSGLVDDV